MTSKSRKGGARRAHFTYVWAIENASYFSLSNKLISPTFVAQTMEMTKWHLEVKVDISKDNMTLLICREPNDGSGSFEIDFEITFLGNNEFQFCKERGTSEFQKLRISRCEVNFYSEEIGEQFPKENLTIRCRMWRKGCDVLQSDLCFARTHMRVEEQSFVWAIKRFSSLRPGQGRTIFLNPTFKTLPTLIFTFCMQEQDGKEYGHIAVHRNQLKEIHYMDVQVCLLDTEGIFVRSTEKNLTALITHEKKKVCDFSELFERTEIMSNKAKFLANDVLLLRCKIEMTAGPLWGRIENYRRSESSDVEAFASDKSETHFDSSANNYSPFKEIFETLYEDGTLSDVSLKAGSQSFSVHKNILGARSPVFKEMFSKDMMDKTAKCVDVPDVSAETLRRLLLYIYTNRLEEMQWDDALNLLRAAHKYELVDLREMCSDFLKAKISTTNAGEHRVLTDMHHEDLKTVQHFLLRKWDKFDFDAFENLIITN